MLRFGANADLRSTVREFGSDKWAEPYLRRAVDMYAYWPQQAPGVPLNIPQPLTKLYIQVDQNWLLDTYTKMYGGIEQWWSLATRENLALTETLNMTDSVTATTNYSLALAETLNMTDTETSIRAVMLSLTEAVDLSDAVAPTGIYGLLLPESLVLQDTADTNGALVAYVVNSITGAPSTYNNFNFNSFAQINNKFYGMTDAGLYELAGDDDAGVAIDSSILFGTTDLSTDAVATDVMKRLPVVYLGVSTAGDLVLGVTANGATNSYTLTASTKTSLHTGRMKLGEGVASRYWDFELTNVAGTDFTLESITLQPVALVRRVNER